MYIYIYIYREREREIAISAMLLGLETLTSNCANENYGNWLYHGHSVFFNVL